MGAPETLSVTPIFRSIDQALHVAFLMDILPVRERGQLDRMIERLMREAGIAPTEVREDGSVNFSGLDALEVRGQCAMIRAAVKDHLPEHEAAAVYARFGHQVTKADGVRGLVSYCGALLATGHADARLAMGWAIYGTEAQRKDITAAAIAREWGIHPKSVERDIATIKRTARRLQELAMDSLQALMAQHGVC